MGYTSIYAITFVTFVGALLLVSKAQPSGSCVSTLTTLSPCLSYITGNSTTPSQTCCSQLDSVIKSSPQCICSAVNSPIPNIGLNINRTQALQLPNACTILAPPLSQCNAATGPTTPPRALSPVDKNPGVALTPTSSPTPGARSGAGGGSKTIPSTGASSSSGSFDHVPPRLLIVALSELESSAAKVARQMQREISGDPNPAKLLHKLAKWDKNAELVSLPGEVSAPAHPRTPQPIQTKRVEKRPTKCFLLRCFRNPRTKEKVEPYRIAGDENGSATPFINAVAPPMVYPPPQAMSGFATPIPYPPPCFGASQPPYTYTSGMFQSPPPRSPPTFQLRKTQFPQMVNYPQQ
ncbi:Non-specific lipid transfer protein GPI-anchored 15 [Hirschfeldia incana]|nr:Non-specific lipid transfer protein GPI-anchored 15 [Hirschfeldia incana]